MINNASPLPTINKTANSTKYIPIINSLRGLASVFVCIYHLIGQPKYFLENTYINKIAHFGSFGVQIFFVITGIVIPIALISGKYTYNLFGKFILKRIIRIEPPYLFSILIIVIYLLLRNHFLPKTSDQIPSAKNLLLHIGYLIPFVKNQYWLNPVYWTLAIEFQFYILISLIFPILVYKKLIIRIIGYIIVFGLSVIFPSDALAPVWLPIFIVGIIYTNLIYKKIKQSEFWSIFIISIAFSFFLHNVTVCIVCVCTLAIIHFFSYYKSNIGDFLGDISYSLYLVHMVFGVAIVNVLSHHVSHIYSKLIVVLFGLLISIILAYLFYLLVEKPSKKLASKISLKMK